MEDTFLFWIVGVDFAMCATYAGNSGIGTHSQQHLYLAEAIVERMNRMKIYHEKPCATYALLSATIFYPASSEGWSRKR